MSGRRKVVITEKEARRRLAACNTGYVLKIRYGAKDASGRRSAKVYFAHPYHGSNRHSGPLFCVEVEDNRELGICGYAHTDEALLGLVQEVEHHNKMDLEHAHGYHEGFEAGRAYKDRAHRCPACGSTIYLFANSPRTKPCLCGIGLRWESGLVQFERRGRRWVRREKRNTD